MEIYEIIALCMLAAAMILLVIRMVREESDTVQKWLIFATTQAEHLLGSGKGQQKLMTVYKMFMDRFPVFSVFVSFETFSRWVDIALDTMKIVLRIEKAEQGRIPCEEDKYGN